MVSEPVNYGWQLGSNVLQGRLCCTVFRSINTSMTQTHHLTESRADREAYKHL